MGFYSVLSANLILLVALAAGIAATVMSIYSWVHTSKLLLPFPISITSLATFLPPVIAIVTPYLRMAADIRKRRSHANLRRATTNDVSLEERITLLSIYDKLMTIVPAVLATLAITYFVPEDILSCRLETQWQKMWRTKDARSIRTVQDRLQCCGLRSQRDRAWPFPNSGGGAEHSCPVVYGYDRSCMVPWAQEQRRVATMIFFSILLATFMKGVLTLRQYGTRVRTGTIVPPEPRRRRLQASHHAEEGGSSSADAHALRVSEEPYTDEPESSQDAAAAGGGNERVVVDAGHQDALGGHEHWNN